jgi:hypothetical protein
MALALLAGTCSAGDRPYSWVTTAAAEEDDDRVWSVDAVAGRLGRVRGADLLAEYAFDPLTSVQFGAGQARERGTGQRSRVLELQLKQLFNHIARDGWGWGLSLEHAFVQAPGEGWRGGHWQLTVPLSVQLGTVALLHANAGVAKAPGERRERVLGLAAEGELARRWVLFGEVLREGDVTGAGLGVRHWVRKDRFAVDVSLQRRRGDGLRAHGVVLGLSWYDL